MPERGRREASVKENIQVVPTEGGWLLHGSFAPGPLAFQSRAEAEQDARAQASRLACAGRHAIVLIYDRAGALAGTDFYAAVEAAGRALV